MHDYLYQQEYRKCMSATDIPYFIVNPNVSVQVKKEPVMGNVLTHALIVGTKIISCEIRTVLILNVQLHVRDDRISKLD